MSVLLVVLMYGLWSSVFALGREAMGHASPVFFTAFRMILAGILLTLFLLIRKREELKKVRKHFLALTLLGVLSVYLTNVLEYYGLKHISAAKTCFIYSVSPFLSLIFSYIHFGEKVNRSKILGTLIGFIGFLPVLQTKMGDENLLQAFGFVSWPELAVMGAAAFSIYGWVLLRIVVKNQDVSPLMANGVSMLLGGFMALVHSSLIESWTPMPFSSEHLIPFIKGITLIILISNIICFNIYGYMLRRFTATFLSFMGLVSPIFSSIIEWFLLGEPLSPQIFLGTAIVSLGLWIVYRSELKQGYILKSPPKSSAPIKTEKEPAPVE